MTEDPGPTEGTTQGKIAELERGVEDARQQLATLLHQQKAARLQTLAATLVILVIILTFGWSLWGFAKENYSEEKLMDIAEKKQAELMQKARTVAQQARDEVVPIYKDMLIATAKRLAPQIEAEARDQLQGLERDIKADLTEVIDSSLKDLKVTLEKDMAAKFPYVVGKDPEEAFQGFLTTMQDKGPEIQGLIDNTIHQEGERIKTALAKFPVRTNLDEIDRAEIEAQWLRLLLQYADYEVSLAGTDEALDWSTGSVWKDMIKIETPAGIEIPKIKMP